MTEGAEDIAKSPSKGAPVATADVAQINGGQCECVDGAAAMSPSPDSGASQCKQQNGTVYASVTTSVLSEFIPSRPTRESSNRALQHQVANVHTAMEQRGLQPRRRKATVLNSSQSPDCDTLRGHYVQYADLDFANGSAHSTNDDAQGRRNGLCSVDSRNGNYRRDNLSSVYGLQRSAVYENLVAPRGGAQASLWFGANHSAIPVPVAAGLEAESCNSPSVEEGSDEGMVNGHQPAIGSAASLPRVTVEELTAAGYAIPEKMKAIRTRSCDSNASVKSSDCEDGQDLGHSRRANDCAPSGSRSNSLNYRKRVSSRRRCVTPLCTSPAPTSRGVESSRRHYEETDLITGLPLDASPTSSAASSPTPAFPWSPPARDLAMNEGTGILHSRSSSAPDSASPLTDDAPNSSPLSPLAQEQASEVRVRSRQTGRALPEPPKRHSSLYSRSQSSDSITMQMGHGHRRQKSIDGAPPLPPKTRPRLNTTTGYTPCHSPSLGSDDPVQSSVRSDELSNGDVHQLRAECSSPASFPGSACASPSPELVNVETLPCRSSWRQSSAQEVFGNFHLQFMGQKEVSCAYGALNSAVESVLNSPYEDIDTAGPCVMNITASALEVGGNDGLYMHHEVDSVETIAPYTGDDERNNNKQCVLAYVVVEEGLSATCFVFRAPTETNRNTVLNTIESALYADVRHFKSMTYPRRVINPENTGAHSRQFSIKHIGSIPVHSAYNSIDEAGRQLLSHTHPAKVSFSFMDLDVDRLRFRKTTSNVIYACHLTHAITSVGSFSEDNRVFGYVMRQRSSLSHTCHLFRCSRPATALAILECIKDVCQESYLQRRRQDSAGSSDDEKSSSGGIRHFFSRKRSSRSSSERKHGGSYRSKSVSSAETEPQQPLDIQRVDSNGGGGMAIVQLSESPSLKRSVTHAEHSVAVSTGTDSAFALHYLGTGSVPQTLSPPKAMTSTIMQNFRNFGLDAGAVPCGSVDVTMRINSQGVTLTDEKNKIFVKRNYPKRTLFHVDQHQADRDLFSFATLPSTNYKGNVGRVQLKVHVFRSTDKPGANIVGVLRGLVEH